MKYFLHEGRNVVKHSEPTHVVVIWSCRLVLSTVPMVTWGNKEKYSNKEIELSIACFICANTKIQFFNLSYLTLIIFIKIANSSLNPLHHHLTGIQNPPKVYCCMIRHVAKLFSWENELTYWLVCLRLEEINQQWSDTLK